MSLVRARDLASLAQVTLACLALATAGGLRWWVLGLAAGLAALAYRRAPRSEPSPGTQRAWTLLVFLALAGTALRVVLLQEIIDAGVDFLLLLVVQRLFNRQRTREHLQLLLLGAILMTIGAVVNTELWFPPLFVAYLPCATFALLLDHLIAEGERLGGYQQLELSRSAARRLPLLRRAALQTAAIAGAGGLAVFALFPRFGMGVFLRGRLPDRVVSGFSPEVRLGSFGTIKDDPTPVLRIRLPPQAPREPRPAWYLRGAVFDTYEGGRWRQSEGGEAPRLRPVASWQVFATGDRPDARPDRSVPGRSSVLALEPRGGFAAAAESLEGTITLEDIGTDVLFVPSEPVALRLQPRGALERRDLRAFAAEDREIRVARPPGPVQYEFLSRVGTPTPSELALVGDPQPPPDFAMYLDHGTGPSRRVADLARDLTAQEPNRAAKVTAVLQHLAGLRYTTSPEAGAILQAGGDPLDDFLFDSRAGHCEYFASAMAILLRHAGVPTRLVNGYFGAQHNDLGDFWLARQADAHSWVEVHFGELGWVTFDPTPPAGRSAAGDAVWWPAGRELFDAVHHAYLTWVIDYDLGKQLALLERAAVTPRMWERSPGRRGLWLSWTAAAAGVAALIVLRRRARRRLQAAPETRLYLGLLARLARAGYEREPSESARAFARRLGAAGAPVGAALVTFSELYEELRFGAGASASDLERLRAAARAVETALR